MQGDCVVSFQAVKWRLLHKLIISQVEGNEISVTLLIALVSNEDSDEPASNEDSDEPTSNEDSDEPASNEDSDEPAQMRSLARAFAARTHKEGTLLKTQAKLWVSSPTR